ncbi:hypothetical protein APHAL10511_006727 [Amanita phalloides]|nr:hypothetical protein APHAL10511_006727 [Amanita phalloides]
MSEDVSNIENEILCVSRPSSGLDCNKLVLDKHAFSSSYPANHVLIKVDRFGFSTNNMTYQALGEHPHFRYFDFHLIPGGGNISTETHGLIPVWGFGTIVVSTHPKIQVGERIYGYLSLAKYLLLSVSPTDVNRYSFYILRPHLPADRRPYNQIIRCATDPQYSRDPMLEDLTMLYRPLFWTAYWCEDWIFASKYRGASFILISSASSKTAFSLAYLMQKRIKRGEVNANTKVIGLTSKKNIDFTTGLDLYHEVLTYDTFAGSPLFYGKATERWIYVDVASNQNLNQNLFSHFSSPYTGRLAACIGLGLTNVSPSSGQTEPIEWSGTSALYSTFLCQSGLKYDDGSNRQRKWSSIRTRRGKS